MNTATVALTPEDLARRVPAILEFMAARGTPCSPAEAAQIASAVFNPDAPDRPRVQPVRKSLRDIHTQKRGKVSDKWEAYFPAYEKHTGHLRHAPVSLLEIGVQNGGSLDVWAEYFAQGEVFVGVDINPLCANLRYDDDRIRVVVGDANQPETQAEITGHATAFDVVIDDGSHLASDIIASFLAYFPLVKPGGVFLIEDTHALYRKQAGGGILSMVSAQEFFKLCAELPNIEHWGAELAPSTLFATFFSGAEPPKWLAAGTIESVEFRPSMIIVRKSPDRAQLGRRIVSGQEASVFPGSLRHFSK